MNEARGSWGCFAWTMLASLLGLIAIAELLFQIDLVPGVDLGGLLAGLIELVGRVIETLTRPF